MNFLFEFFKTIVKEGHCPWLFEEPTIRGKFWFVEGLHASAGSFRRRVICVFVLEDVREDERLLTNRSRWLVPRHIALLGCLLLARALNKGSHSWILEGPILQRKLLQWYWNLGIQNDKKGEVLPVLIDKLCGRSGWFRLFVCGNSRPPFLPSR